jgi:hypothetical protein
MRPDEPKNFDPHEPIDLSNEGKMAEMTEKLEVSRDELTQAVERVGPQPVAVAIFLGRLEALEVST